MSNRPMEACSLTELHRHPSACIARAIESRNPLFITRRGKPVALLMSVETYEQMHRGREALTALALGSLSESSARIVGNEITRRVSELQGDLKAAKHDEDDHRRYLEEKRR